VTKPSSALYWHIGGAATRFRSVTSFSRNGVNKADMA
jgi:hypothetical protein